MESQTTTLLPLHRKAIDINHVLGVSARLTFIEKAYN
jgi:hypothetical protein